MSEIHYNQEFKGTDEFQPPSGEYEDCRFISINWNNSDIRNNQYIGCSFIDCDLSGARVENTIFTSCDFLRCKMLGIRFDLVDKHLFSASFEACILDLSSFYQRKMPSTEFRNCSLREADFTQATLSGSVFNDCDLAKAVFESTVLEKCDFRSSENFSIHPESNHIRGALFSRYNLAGLLDQYGIRIE